MKHKDNIPERREYIRMETVFPVEFQLFSAEKNEIISPLKQGFTRDVSEGGMCLEVKELENGFIHQLEVYGTELKLFVNVPHQKDPVEATAQLRWARKVKEGFPSRYLIGIEYIDISNDIRKSIIKYAKQVRRKSKILIFSILLLLAGCGFLVWQVYDIGAKKEITESELAKLGNELVKSREKESVLENRIFLLNIKKQQLEQNISLAKNEIDTLEEQISKLTVKSSGSGGGPVAQINALEKELLALKGERGVLLSKLEDLKDSKEIISKQLLSLRKADEVKFVRVRLKNGNLLTGQILDVSKEKVNLKIGLGSIGIEKSMIDSMKEVSESEKNNIQSEWILQEEEARKLNNQWKKLVQTQYEKGLVYFNGKWIEKQEAEEIQNELKRREDAIFRFLSEKSVAGLSEEKKDNLLKDLLQKGDKSMVSVKDRRIFLNGRLFFIKGIGYGIEYPKTPGGMATFDSLPLSVFEKDFKMIKDAGINTIRTYEPLPPKLLNLAEKYGIMVIENICYPSDYTDFNSRVHLDILKEQIRKYVKRDKDRKCILMWSIWNDAPWTWGSRGNAAKRYGFSRVNRFLKELYETVKQYDISHPVTAGNAIGIYGENLGWEFLDVIGLNLYLGGFDWFTENEAKRQVKGIKEIEEKYNKPVVILETGFSTYVKGQDQADVLEKQIKAAGENLAGITIFQWADGWQKAGDFNVQDEHIEEHWGILDGYRNPKDGYDTVAEMFNEIPTESYGYSEGLSRGKE